MALPLTSFLHRSVNTPSLPPQRLTTWLEISLFAFEHNVGLLRQLIERDGHSALLAVVVKSNAYGHGLLEISKMCEQSSHVDWICTATLSDAIILRKNGISKPIIVLSTLDAPLDHAFDFDIDITVADRHTVELVINTAEALVKAEHNREQQNEQGERAVYINPRSINIHLKVDTGLSRFGFLPDELLELVPTLKNVKNIVIRGIYTHFAQSDNSDQTFTLRQYRIFHDLLANLGSRGVTIPIYHTHNSAACLVVRHDNPKHHDKLQPTNQTEQKSLGNSPQANSQPYALNLASKQLVRIGACAYGLEPSTFCTQHLHNMGLSFQPVMTWKTRINALRTIKKGEYIGYALTYQTVRETTIALLPVGYFDGYSRRLSNKGIVGVLGPNRTLHYAPVVGRVCMNILMIDVTEVPHCAIGDEVILLGDFPHLRAHDMAALTGGGNPREVTTTIPAHVPRNYF